jgi:hypothetical protein
VNKRAGFLMLGWLCAGAGGPAWADDEYILRVTKANALDPDPTLTDEKHEREWSADILLTYLVNPGTAIYLGYIDQYENVGIVAGNPPSLRRTGRPETSVGRQWFAKVSYLLRF